MELRLTERKSMPKYGNQYGSFQKSGALFFMGSPYNLDQNTVGSIWGLRQGSQKWDLESMDAPKAQDTALLCAVSLGAPAPFRARS